MHWQDTEIAVIEHDGRFYALNAWDGECFSRCWECADRVGDKFCSVVGELTCKIWQNEDGFRLEYNDFSAMESVEYMYKVLVPYSGAANSVGGEMLRAILALEAGRSGGAIRFLEANLSDEIALEILDRFRAGDFAELSRLKKMVENMVFAWFLANEFEDNFEDFEDM